MIETLTITKPNTVLKDAVVGRVIVQAPGFRALRVTAVGTGTEKTNVGLFDFTHPAASGSLTDCIARPARPNLWLSGVLGHDFKAENVTITHTVDGFGVYNTHNHGGALNVLIDGSTVQDLAYFIHDPNHPDKHTHNDCVQIQGGSGITITNSILRALIASNVGNASKNPYAPAATGQAIGVTPNVAKVTGLVVRGNRLDGGAQSITMIPGKFGPAHIGVFEDNIFGHGQHNKRAAAIHPTLSADWSGNHYHDGGLANLISTTAL